jgi:ATP-dependent helicase/DNAse subunit B
VPLTLVLGPANSAKAGEVLGAYAAASRRDALLVVPTAPDVGHYTRELAGQQVVFGSVLTFNGLTGEIAARAGFDATRLSRLQRERVLRRLAAGLTFEALGASAQARGFPGAAGGLIAEFQRALITPQRLAVALTAWAAEDPRRGPYARDLGMLYRAYTAELGRHGHLDSEQFAWRALDALRAEPAAWGATPVYFYGFDDLLEIERDAVETLARVVGVEVVVSLTYESGRAALSARAGVVEELRAVASVVRELPAADEHYAPGAREALHRLERHLFETVEAPADPGSSARLLEAGGERGEAELIAAEVLGLLRGGVPPEEIVVVARSLGRSGRLLELVFERYGIPVASERPIPLTHTSLGRGVIALARCALLDPDAATATDLLTYLRAPGLLDRLEVADALEAELRRDGVTGAEQARRRLGWKLEEIDALRAAADAAAELGRHARRLLAAPHRAEAAVLDASEELDARALRTILEAFEELKAIDERLSGPELIELLETLELAPRRVSPIGAVLLAEPLGIRARRFRVAFVCGLCEGEFPLAGTSEPFLSDEQRRELALVSGLRLTPREDTLALERYLFYSAVSRATEQVVFSYRSSDEEGNLILPSPFIADLVELFGAPWRDRRRRRLLADVTWSAEEAPTAREYARAQVAAGAPRTAQRGGVRWRARDLRPMPGPLAGRTPALTGALRARSRPVDPRELHARGAGGGPSPSWPRRDAGDAARGH